jgi:electron transfer flavoprotein beta subunit
VRIDKKTGKLVYGTEETINPPDRNALELALQIKDKKGAKVTALSLTSEYCDAVLREALAMGVDDAIIVTDKIFKSADSILVANVLAQALKKLDYTLIIFGENGCGIPYASAYTGVRVAHKLNLPVVTGVCDAQLDENEIEVLRKTDMYNEILKIPLPAAISVRIDANKPRFLTARNINLAYKREIKKWSAQDLIDVSKIKTAYKVVNTNLRFEKSACMLFTEGDASTKVAALMKFIKNRLVIQRL